MDIDLICPNMENNSYRPHQQLNNTFGGTKR